MDVKSFVCDKSITKKCSLMKRIFYLILLCLPGCYSPQNKKEALNSLPSFNMLLIDGMTTFYAQEIPTGRPIVLFFFRPDCPHCQEETRALVDHMNSLTNVQFYMISLDPLEKIKEFYVTYHLDQYKNLTIGEDNEHTFIQYFRPSTVPYFAIYDANKKLVKIFNGGTEIDDILKATHI
jgi:thiol-disulfide isomerase/thioredoxin